MRRTFFRDRCGRMHNHDLAGTLKADAARRQLGTALHLWLADLDPVSVHVLVSGGCEVANALVQGIGKPFSAFTHEVHPDLSERDLVKLRNVFWNAMKHAKNRNGQLRDDEEVLATPLESENETRLMEGWFDLMQVMPVPIEAHVLTVWHLAKYGKPGEVDDLIGDFFPALRFMPTDAQKGALRHKINEMRQNGEMMRDPLVDPRPLIIPG